MAAFLNQSSDNHGSHNSGYCVNSSIPVNIGIDSLKEEEIRSTCHRLLCCREVRPVCPSNFVRSVWMGGSHSSCKASDHRTQRRETDSLKVNEKHLRLLRDGVDITAKITSQPSSNPLSSLEDQTEETTTMMTTRINDSNQRPHHCSLPTGSYQYNINEIPIAVSSSTDCSCPEMVSLSEILEKNENTRVIRTAAGESEAFGKQIYIKPSAETEVPLGGNHKENLEEKELRVSKLFAELHESYRFSKNPGKICSAGKYSFVHHACQSSYYQVRESTSSSVLVPDAETVHYLPPVAYRDDHPSEDVVQKNTMQASVSNGKSWSNLQKSADSTPAEEIIQGTPKSSESLEGGLHEFLPWSDLVLPPIRFRGNKKLLRSGAHCSASNIRRLRVKKRRKRKLKTVNSLAGMDSAELSSLYSFTGFPNWQYPTMVVPACCWYPSSLCGSSICPSGPGNMCRQLPIRYTEQCQPPRRPCFARTRSPSLSPVQVTPDVQGRPSRPSKLVRCFPKPSVSQIPVPPSPLPPPPLPAPPPFLVPTSTPSQTQPLCQSSCTIPPSLPLNPFASNPVPSFFCPPSPNFCPNPYAHMCWPQPLPSSIPFPSVLYPPVPQSPPRSSPYLVPTPSFTQFNSNPNCSAPKPLPTCPPPPQLPPYYPCQPVCCICNTRTAPSPSPSQPIRRRRLKPRNVSRNWTRRRRPTRISKNVGQSPRSLELRRNPGILPDFFPRNYSCCDVDCPCCPDTTCSCLSDMDGECCGAFQSTCF